MVTCIITGSNDKYLVNYTLRILIELQVRQIIVVTNKPCLPCIRQEYEPFQIRFSYEEFQNKNEALLFAFQFVKSGRILFLESGSMPTKKSVEIHCNAGKRQVICGLYTRVYDFESNFEHTPLLSQTCRVDDVRLRHHNLQETGWMMYAVNNSSVDADGIHLINGFDASFCVDGVTENADFAYALHGLGYEFILSKEARYDTYTKLEQLQQKPAKLKTLYLWFTDHCNYHCRMCRIGQRAYRAAAYQEPSLETIKRIIVTASKAGISKLELYGGEMLMRRDLSSVIEYANLYRIETGFVTNGSLITEELSERFYQLGVKDIPVSLDASVPELNDWVRGRGAWKKTMDGIRHLKNHNNTFSLFTVVMQQNFHAMSDMVRLAKELGAASVSFQPISSRQGGTIYKELALKYSDVPKLKKEILRAFELSELLHLPIRSRQMVRTIPEYILRDEQLILQKGCTLPMSEALITKTNKLQLCFTPYGPKDIYRKTDGLDIALVWGSSSYQQLQKLALTGQCPGCLANCSDLDYLFSHDPTPLGSQRKEWNNKLDFDDLLPVDAGK